VGAAAPQPPDLWWPEDRAWFVATDTDLSWLYVGGTTDLTNELPERTTPVGSTDPIGSQRWLMMLLVR